MSNNLNLNKPVIINGRFLCNSMNGIGRFSLEICKQLKKNNLLFEILIPQWLEYSNEEKFKLTRYGNLKSHFWEQIDLLRFLKSNGNPLLINLSGLGPLCYKRQIVTIHDLSFFANKAWFSKSYTLFYSYATPIIAKNSLKIITVSEFSKNEIIKYLQIDANKIEVIHNAVSVEFKKKLIKGIIDPIITEKYILAVSSIDPRKNLQRLIDVFSNLGIEGYKLVLVGKESKHFNVKLSTKSDNIIFTGFVSDNDLLNLYQNCEFFIYPTLYEGFGIPPLEAMKNECAVIVSQIPSMQEVCGDAVLYVNPYDKKDIGEGMLKIINDSNLKKELQIRGKQRVDIFSWEKSGYKAYDLIKKYLN